MLMWRVRLQVTGEAIYTEDSPVPPGTLHAALVTSRVAHGRIASVDASPATQVPGVHGYFGAEDVPGCNRIGAVFPDEFVFAEDEVTCVGQPIGIVVADTPAAAKRAAALVKVWCQPCLPCITVPCIPVARRHGCGQRPPAYLCRVVPFATGRH